ncbi:hypothetical protein DFP73DRAFT_599843 [Morchella snyderi]|nr:hypothetical protein DFP73DRAFT_599843 [Morchella snyderi]
MSPNKRSAGSALLSAKRPRLPVTPEEHDDSQTDGSEISFRALTALSTSTRSSQSTSTRSSQSTTTPIARKGLLRSSDTSTGRSSPRRVEFHLPDGNTDSAEVQEQQEDVPEVEETADTSHLEYDDSPENDHESSEENLDDPEEEPQASTQRSQSTGKRPRTVQPTTARALGNARRRPTGAVAEVIASSDVSVDVVQGNTTGCEGNTERRSRESSTHFGTQTKCIPENAHRIPESIDFGTQPGSISSMPSSVPVYSRDIDYSSSTRHINLSSMRSRYGDSSPTYSPYRSSPPFEGVGESSMSSPRIPSSPQVYLPEAQPRVYDIAQLSSSNREEENAPIAESERSLLTSSRSVNVLSMQAQRIEKECSTLIGDHTLLHEPFPPALRLSVLVVSMWAAASCWVGCTVDPDEVVIKQVRSLHSRVRSHLMHEVKGRLADSTIYGPGNLSNSEARAAQAEYLLKNDRFLSSAQHYDTYRLRFLAPEIIDILYYKYFDRVRMRGVKDPDVTGRLGGYGERVRGFSNIAGNKQKQVQEFHVKRNRTIQKQGPRGTTERFIRLEFDGGIMASPETFNRMSNTWKGGSRQNQEATLEVIKDNLREKIREKKGITIEVIPEDGFSEDDEALAADLAAFRNARKAPPSALVDPSGSDNGGSQEEVVHAQLLGIEAEEEGEENEEEQEEGDHEGGGEEGDV